MRHRRPDIAVVTDVRLHTLKPHSNTFRGHAARHALLKYAKELRTPGIRVDDDLTRRQQQQMFNLDNVFKSLRSKGYRPRFRGAQLPCRTNN